RVDEQRDEKETLLVEARDGLARLRKLHQRDATLLHARAARRGDRKQRQAPLERQLRGARDRLADATAHAAADEREVHDHDDEGIAVDRRRSVERALAIAGLLLGSSEPLRIRLRIGERERIDGLDARAQILEA